MLSMMVMMNSCFNCEETNLHVGTVHTVSSFFSQPVTINDESDLNGLIGFATWLVLDVWDENLKMHKLVNVPEEFCTTYNPEILQDEEVAQIIIANSEV